MRSKRATALGFCDYCQKLTYVRKRDARAAARAYVDAHMNVYTCEENPAMYHVGHLAQRVIDGAVDRRSIYGRNW